MLKTTQTLHSDYRQRMIIQSVDEGVAQHECSKVLMEV